MALVAVAGAAHRAGHWAGADTPGSFQHLDGRLFIDAQAPRPSPAGRGTTPRHRRPWPKTPGLCSPHGTVAAADGCHADATRATRNGPTRPRGFRPARRRSRSRGRPAATATPRRGCAARSPRHTASADLAAARPATRPGRARQSAFATCSPWRGGPPSRPAIVTDA